MNAVVSDLARVTAPQIGFLLVWVGMVALLAVALAALVNVGRLNLAYRWRTVQHLCDALLTPEPRQKMVILRYLVGLLNSMAGVLALNYGVQRGVIDAEACRELTVSAFAVGLGWYALLRLGWNKRLADPSMTEPQMVSAIVLLGWGYAIGGPGSPVALMLLFIILMFSMFKVTIRQLVRCSLLGTVVFGYAMWTVGTQAGIQPIVVEMQRVYFGVLVIMLISVCLLMTHLSGIRQRATQHKRELGEVLDKLRELSIRDELTGLFNRRHMLELLGTERARSERSGQPWSVALIDVDHFKAVNDSHGHGVGDEVLHTVAQVISDGLRDADQVARWGGEEFLVLFPDTDCDNARLVLQRIRQELATTLVSRAVPDLRVTFSAGVSCFDGEEALARTIERADQALYLAKAGGRNRTEHHRAAPRRVS